MRVAVVTSHPIQYQAPWFRALATRIDLEVFFCHRQDDAGQAEAGYQQPFGWDVPLLDGYHHTWLTNVSRRPGVFSFAGCDTPDVSRHLRDGRFDACIVCGWYLKSYLQALLAARRLGLPVLLRGDSHLGTERTRLRRAAKYVPYRLLLGSVAGHLYVGSLNRRYLQHYGVPDARLFFVPHVVDNDFFATAAAKAREEGVAARIRAETAVVPPDRALALFVGRLVPKKHPEDFVRALARLASASRQVAGVIVGSGPLEPDLRTLVSALGAPVSFAGFRNQRELPGWYAAADVLALPSDGGETWGLVVNEALACGVPVVVSDAVGCAPDLVRPGAGRTYPLGDVPALAEALYAVVDERRRDPEGVRSAVGRVTSAVGVAVAADNTVDALGRVTARRSAA